MTGAMSILFSDLYEPRDARVSVEERVELNCNPVRRGRQLPQQREAQEHGQIQR